MEQEIKYSGFSATPDDYIVPDGELAASIGVVPENGALHPVFPPSAKFALGAGEQLMWIHRITGHTHYILLRDGFLYWVCEENGEGEYNAWTRHQINATPIDGTPTISSIGNTLVVNDDSGVNYFLWSTDRDVGSGYTELGQKPPMLEITFGLHSDFAVWPDKKNTSTKVSKYGGADIKVGNIKNTIIPQLGESEGDDGAAWAAPRPVMAADSRTSNLGDRIRTFAAEQATYSIEEMTGDTDDEKNGLSTMKNVLTQGVFARLNLFVGDRGTKENKFVLPFFIRYAYRMYDETYIMHSYPVLLIPNSRGPVFALDGKHGLALNDNDDNFVGLRVCGRVYGFLSQLVYSVVSIPDELKQWKDLITSVDIGVSAPVFTFDQAGSVYGWTNMDDANAWDEYYSISKVTKLAGQDVAQAWPNGGINPFKSVFGQMESKFRHGDYGDYFNRYNSSYSLPSYIATVPQKNISDINNTLTGPTDFYIVKQFELDELAPCTEKELEMDEGTLGGLLGRECITDDYHSHDHIKATMMYNYNGRMNYAGVTRTPHAPINPAVQFAQGGNIGSGDTWQVAVTVKNDTQQLTVQGVTGRDGLEFPRWIYYPDANAKAAYITKGGVTYKVKLTPHDHLNGAYWLANIMSQSVLPTVETATLPAISTGGFVEENKLYTSNVNNPWHFEVGNIKSIGYGKILAITSAAKAMSTSQFGQFPLYAFTDEGVWALEVTPTGSFNPSQPFTRDVCISPESITQLDSAVLFATDRGIMLVQGSTSLCISDAIFTRTPFLLSSLPKAAELLELAGMDAELFNYVSFLDFIRNCRMVYDYVHQHVIIYNPGHAYAYLYSLESKKWGLIESHITGNPNSYPDALVVLDDGNAGTVASYSVPDLSDAEMPFLFVTRPIKLGASDVMKTVNTIIQRGYMDRFDVKQVLYGSRDMKNWQIVYSSNDIYLRGFRGSPYKYFRIALFGNLEPDESVTGATVQFEPRLTNRLR